MKIGILIDELPTSSAPKIVGEETYHLNEHGVNCKAYVLKYKDNEVLPPHTQHIRLIHLDENLNSLTKKFLGWRIPTFSFFSLYHIVYPYLLSNKASKILDDHDALIVHSTSTALFSSKLKLKKAKSIFYWWDPLSYIFESAYSESWSNAKRKLLSHIGKFVDKKTSSTADLIILPSKFHYRRVKSLVPDKPIKIVYPGVNVATNIPTNRGDFILSVARWEKGKNPFFLIEIATILSKEFHSFKIYIVGPWKPPALLKEFLLEAKKKGVIKNFEIVGPKFGDDLTNLYLRSRVLLHPKVEAFGFTGLEAAANGCPFIFPKDSGVTDLFTHGIHGFFPKEGNVVDYAKYAAMLLSDEKLAWNMGYEAWRIAKQYTWEEHAKRLLEVIESIC